MKKEVSKKSMILIFGTFLVVIISIGSLFYLNLKESTKLTVEATVKFVGNNYIIVVDEKNQEYSLPTKEEYQVGDKISAFIENVDKTTNPRKGEVIKIDTISKSVQFSIVDDPISNEMVQEKQQAEPNTSVEDDSQQINNDTLKTDEDVLAYFETLDRNLDSYSKNQSLGATIKSEFVTVVDFLFYNGKIKGKTFSELKEKTKLQVLKIAFSIDQKIETYFPNYKEEVSSTSNKIYTNIKAKGMELYLDTTTKICANNQELCTTAKEGLTELKESFSITWNFIKEISGIGISKLKSWYEVWKDAE